MSPAEKLLGTFSITDGFVLEVKVLPMATILHVEFHSFVNGKWSAQDAKITLSKPEGLRMNYVHNYWGYVGPPEDPENIDDYFFELGDLQEIEAKGPLNAAEFRLLFGSNEIYVKKCELAIERIANDKTTPQAPSQQLMRN